MTGYGGGTGIVFHFNDMKIVESISYDGAAFAE